MRGERRIEPIEQQVRQTQLLTQDGAAGRFRRMGHEHRFDAQRTHQALQVFERTALRLQTPDRVGDAARLWLATIIEEIGATAPDAVQLLSEVDRLEPSRERAFEIARNARRPIPHARLELFSGRCIATPTGDGERAVALDDLEQGFTALLAQHLTDQCAEHVHIVAQRGVLGGEIRIGTIHARSLHPTAASTAGRRMRRAAKGEGRRDRSLRPSRVSREGDGGEPSHPKDVSGASTRSRRPTLGRPSRG
jgi:hypothetical protein